VPTFGKPVAGDRGEARAMFFLLRCLFWLALVTFLAGHAPQRQIEALLGHTGQASQQAPLQAGGRWLAEACLSAPERCREAGSVLMPLAAAAAPSAEAPARRAASAKAKHACSPACAKP
jgi:hypothetical protein